MTQPPAAEIGQRLRAAARARSDEVVAPSREIYGHPELSSEEFNARDNCVALLREHGFDIDSVPGVDTAFVATLEGRSTTPTIGLLAEHDSLPEIGHACGHHLIADSAVGAGLALAARRDVLPSTVKVFGCPSAETGTGKAAMISAGAFSGTDAALTFHASEATSVTAASSAIRELCITFSGRASHAAAAPWDGRSALDGVLLTYQNVNALRQFVRDGVRIHGLVTHGGDAFNTVPETASCTLGVRSLDATELTRVVERVCDCARGAALATRTDVSINTGMRVEPLRFNETLGALVRAHLAEHDTPVEDWAFVASTDFGDVSNILPALLFSIATCPEGIALHTREAAEYGSEPRALAAMLKAAEVMAASRLDLFLAPELLVRAGARLTEAREADGTLAGIVPNGTLA